MGIRRNSPDNGEHEALDAGDAQVVVRLLGLVLQYVLHDENHILDEHRVHVGHNCLIAAENNTQPFDVDGSKISK